MRFSLGKEHNPDYTLITIIFVILTFGLIMLSSASSVVAYQDNGNSYHQLFNQLVKGVLPGLLVFFIASRTKYTFWKKAAIVLFVFALVLMIAVFIPGIGAKSNNARSWIKLFVFRFQPAEFLKLALIVYLASFFSKPEIEVKDSYKGFLPFVLILSVCSGLLILQPDIGTLSIVVSIAMGIYLVAGANIWHFIAVCLTGLGGVGVLIMLAPYRLNRLLAFLDPSKDPLGISYHINQALIAVGSGKFFGVGLGQSRQKFAYLPEVFGDSIFAIIGEEMGFLVALILVGLFVFLVIRGFRIAQDSGDEFAKLTAFGISFWFVFQAVVNIMSMIGLMPMTGVPLTLISYGGSAMIMNLLAAGILVNISKWTTR